MGVRAPHNVKLKLILNVLSSENTIKPKKVYKPYSSLLFTTESLVFKG